MLTDIDWRAGTVGVNGKGGRRQVMPLPVDVGEAIACYLGKERPRGSDEHVFLRALAPHTGMTAAGISQVITSLGVAAGIPARIGAHRLRHTAATAVLAAGGSLTEAGQLMRHDDLTSTVIYAKVDLVSLRTLARPWSLAQKAGCTDIVDAGRAGGRS